MSETMVLRVLLALLAACVLGSLPASPPAIADELTTAWHDGKFVVDTPNVVRRSNIVLGGANLQPTESMPLGNGTLGVAEWAANGFTAQLNRGDTLPDRKSPGRVVIPGLARLTTASDFKAHLDLFDAVLTETGGGMSATIYVRSDSDQLVVDVTGADPSTTQTARLGLWDGRHPQAKASGNLGVLAETWKDDSVSGASGQQFGSLAVITAGGLNVTASVLDAQTVGVTFKPRPDGSFRVVVAAPHWPQGDPSLGGLLGALPADAGRDTGELEAGHVGWWHQFWNRVGLIRLSSSDGSAEYLENLRTLYLYATAAESRGILPGSQAGVADLFSFSQADDHDWNPAAYWVWNLRMQQAANMRAGAFDLNAPLYRLYRQDLTNLQNWTANHMPGHDGICVPETMRFNGNGFYIGTLALSNASCDSTIAPSWNSQTITSGAEIGLWIWQQYLMTDDRAFLADHYPIMSNAARFLLSYATVGPDGLLHTESNAHETQWHVRDPVTDVAAMQALFPAVVEAATTLSVDADLVTRLKDALPRVRALPRTDVANQTLTPEADANGATVIAISADPAATKHNVENLELEAVWPYAIIGDSGPLTDLARRTYQRRAAITASEWSFDPVHAARLGLRDDVASSLLAITKNYQIYPSGMASLTGKPGQEPYIEQSGVLATALADALAQDYDGLLRIAPAVPSAWDADASIFIQHQSQVHLQVRHGVPITVVVEAGANYTLQLRNPWPGQSVTVLDNRGTSIIGDSTAETVSFDVRQGGSYLIQRAGQPAASLAFAAITGTTAGAARHLGNAKIGLDPPRRFASIQAAFDNIGVSDDATPSVGNFDGSGDSFSVQALSQAGLGPGGSVTHAGASFSLALVGTGNPDNVVAAGQFITISGGGSKLAFLVAASNGSANATGLVMYNDGTSEPFSISVPDWTATPPSGSDVALAPVYQNRPTYSREDRRIYIYDKRISLNPGKQVSAIQLPGSSATTSTADSALHVFALALTP